MEELYFSAAILCVRPLRKLRAYLLDDSYPNFLILILLSTTPIPKITKKATDVLASMSSGDARVALNGLEVAAKLANKKSITPAIVEQAMQQTALKYDKNGEDHYNTISAFIKSMRGSDPDAALYYMHRMIASGEDPKFIARRMVIFASEDIGMAAPYALTLAVSAFQAVERIGLPEAEYALSRFQSLRGQYAGREQEYLLPVPREINPLPEQQPEYSPPFPPLLLHEF